MEKYLKNCKKLFPIYGKDERQYIERLESHIREYQTEHENCTYEDLVTQFGSPTEVVSSYYRSTNYHDLLKKVNFVRRTRIFIVIIISAVIIFLGYKSYELYQDYLRAKDESTIYVEDVIIEYIEE